MAQDYILLDSSGPTYYTLPRDAQDASGFLGQTRGASTRREPSVSGAFEIGDQKWRPRELTLSFAVVGVTKEEAAALSDAIFTQAQAATSIIREVDTGEDVLAEDGTQLLAEDGTPVAETIGNAQAVNVLSRITARQWFGDASNFTITMRWLSRYGQATLSIAETSEDYAAADKTLW